ncbi:unknown [Clostridium sp. CAG:465]|nr:unknown [Clostridium sp. CAG:465]
MKETIKSIIACIFFSCFTYILLQICVLTESGQFEKLPKFCIAFGLFSIFLPLIANYNDKKDAKAKTKAKAMAKAKAKAKAMAKAKAKAKAEAIAKEESRKRRDEIIDSLYRSYVYDLCEKAMEPYRKQPPHD